VILRVLDAMTRKIVFCSPDSPVRNISKLMWERNISSVVVLRENSTCGIITQHDLVGKVIAAGLDPDKTTVEKIMSQPVITVDSDAELTDAARIMRDKRIKKLVAVKNGVAVGIVTSFDIIVAAPAMRLILERAKRGA
jgi:CBS domain-containing protein